MIVEEKNNLYPIFLKVHQLNVLLIGAGNVGLEKLSFLLKSSPNAKVQIVAIDILPEVKNLAEKHHIEIIQEAYKVSHLHNKDLVIVATDDNHVNIQAYNDCKEQNLLVNVADTPHLCDFYLGGIVTKGNVKVAISTNGKSPTTAKRLRQFFEEVIPEDINELVQNLNKYRKTIKGNFEEKVETLNKLTEGLIS
ncbi:MULTISPECIES: bifunctional precorrin-2 dehydrogenase/sirohydrochlorin ferrochelatase [unclassified Tenacibaculum]|uniref:precorrin-2 dehydrogenase/sirohydrochlorin ferrochelatase family protein n=1 Tax=unclassified Tenacibaculum TaxID=2635139 RepID=UPI001F2006F5|nr:MULTISPECIES: bifunctional precorrin-2 dehydrogenase/sirohydrochlorin ferrochelatase [unclassified Tenacibaculum]MCF2873609.1 bifunctional precorrin-2 dehydrogenase/sirohydrochlorin ferrochelatase [Tenacibaculum sp. Cn5-1]MCF2933765.1 bifunctional precorrin-2 dehydrogenase/sirohydrochlorin ferrochelatase [Tenacibaculum sp. Cn5-34]MCG7509653.1 bifunctional precorrin-2 dehydrogenase/sirohydrochlorin ferrochelatase [Tenacibaculum sp. Cn5-46]